MTPFLGLLVFVGLTAGLFTWFEDSRSDGDPIADGGGDAGDGPDQDGPAPDGQGDMLDDMDGPDGDGDGGSQGFDIDVSALGGDVSGGLGDDRFVGDFRQETALDQDLVLRGLDGNDTMDIEAFASRFDGASGPDMTLDGGAGEDIFSVHNQTDASIVAQGGLGNDALYGDDNAILSGGEGNDTLIAFGDDGGLIRMEGGAGGDTFHIISGSANLANPNGPSDGFGLTDGGALEPIVVINDFDPAVDTLVVPLGIGEMRLEEADDQSHTDIVFTDELDGRTAELRTRLLGVSDLAESDLNVRVPSPLDERGDPRYIGYTFSRVMAADVIANQITPDGPVDDAYVASGDGDDDLTFSDSNWLIDLGAGDDSLSGRGGSGIIRGGAGDDEILHTTGDGASQIRAEGGAGDDVIVLGDPEGSGDGRTIGYIDGGDGNDTLTLHGQGTVDGGVGGDDIIDISDDAFQQARAFGTGTSVFFGNGDEVRAGIGVHQVGAISLLGAPPTIEFAGWYGSPEAPETGDDFDRQTAEITLTDTPEGFTLDDLVFTEVESISGPGNWISSTNVSYQNQIVLRIHHSDGQGAFYERGVRLGDPGLVFNIA